MKLLDAVFAATLFFAAGALSGVSFGAYFAGRLADLTALGLVVFIALPVVVTLGIATWVLWKALRAS